MKILKLFSFERLCWLAAIIALLILLNHCGKTGAATAARYTDSLRLAEKQAHDSTELRQFRYSLDSARFAQAASKARDSSAKAWAKVSTLQEQIRQKQRDMGVIAPPLICDTCESHRLWDKHAAECCVMAGKLADQADVLKVADSLKDAAFNEQLTLASGMVNAQSLLLQESHGRFNQLDSVYMAREEANRPRGSVWTGVDGQIGPVSSAGIYLRYETPRGKEYGVSGGRQQYGWYGGVRIGFKLSFRRAGR